MDVPGYALLLQDFCAYCPDFEAKVETIDEGLMTNHPKACHEIRCENSKRCLRMAENIKRQVITDGED